MACTSAEPLPGLDEWLLRTHDLLKVEQQAERDQALERVSRRDTGDLVQSGRTLLSLAVSDSSVGLYGRCILTLRSSSAVASGGSSGGGGGGSGGAGAGGSRGQGGQLAAHKLRVGDVVSLAPKNGRGGAAAAVVSAGGAAGGAGGGAPALPTGIVIRVSEGSLRVVRLS